MKEENRIAPETLENGRVLQMLVEQLENTPCEEHYVAVLRCLRDSLVWIPGEIRISQLDARTICQKKAGDSFSPQQDMKFIPGLLKMVKNFFCLFFQIWKLWGNTADLSVKFNDISLMPCVWLWGQEDVSGIVLDPFTSPCVVLKGDFDFIGNLPSLLKLD